MRREIANSKAFKVLALAYFAFLAFYIPYQIYQFNQQAAERRAAYELRKQDHDADFAQKLEQIRRSGYPRYEDFPSLSDVDFSKLSGNWEVLQYWSLGLCMYSRDRDQPRGYLYGHGVSIEKNTLRFGHYRLSTPAQNPAAVPRVAAEEVPPLDPWTLSTIWGYEGVGTVTFADLRTDCMNEPRAAMILKGGNPNRGKYQLDGDELRIYWVLNVEGITDRMKRPEDIPAVAHHTESQMLVLKRFPEKSTVPSFTFGYYQVKEMPEHLMKQYQEQIEKLTESRKAPLDWKEFENRDMPPKVRDAVREQLEFLRKP